MSWAALPPLVAVPCPSCDGTLGFADEFGAECCGTCFGLGTTAICPDCQEEPRIVGGFLGELCGCVHVTSKRAA